MFLRPRMTRYGGHAGPYVWGGVTGVTDPDNPWLSAVQENTATRLVVSANSYDAEQRFLVNENPLSVRTALGVGLGTAGCAGPIFAPDQYGSAMWLNQRLGSAAGVKAVLPTFTDGTKVTFELDFDVQPGELGTQFVLFFETGAIRIYTAGSSDRRLFYYDGSAASAVTSSLTSYGLTLGDRWKARVVIDGTSITGYASLDNGETWGANVSAVRASQNFSGKTMYVGSSNTTNGVRCKYYGVTVRDGDENAEVVAEFTPGLFVGGNRADGDTAVDAYGVTWTITRPSVGSDIPTDNTTRLSFDGTADYGQVVGDDTITNFVPATGLTVLLDAAFGSGAASGAVFASSANATTDDGIIISRNGTNERIQGRVDDGTTIATVGDNADNITYDTRFQAAFAFGDSDHEAYVDGVSVETATDAVGSIAAAGPLRLGAEIDGSNKAAFDLYAFAVVGDDMTDTEVAAAAAEGLAI